MSANLLVELFTEELPPKALQTIGIAFADRIYDSLVTSGLIEESDLVRVGQIQPWGWYASPRRLAVRIIGALSQGATRDEVKKLMPSKVAFGTDGKPTEALLKRLGREGATPDQIARKIEGNVEYIFLNRLIPGITLAVGLQTAIEDSIAKLPIPKVMSYQLADGATTVKFVRPAHGLVALHGAEIVPISILGLKAGRITHGHRFLGVKDIPVDTADAYEEALAAHGKIIASFDDRRAEIERQLVLHAQKLQLHFSIEPTLSLQEELNGLPELDALISEVTALVEYPSVYVCEFEPSFLAVPQECLVLTMRTNQKYFPLFDTQRKLTNKFLIVSNTQLVDPKNIVEGNQRVIRPRLADARFFFETDKKIKLENRVPQLANIVYHNKLGTQLERIERIKWLAGLIAGELGIDVSLTMRASHLCKADLTTNMVGEFPELQGIMGKYYALHDGEELKVANAIEQHYRPRFSGDVLPENSIASAVALADKILAITALFRANERPTGEKDPLALRRQALSVLRILIEQQQPLDLLQLIKQVSNSLADASFAKSTGEELQRQFDSLSKSATRMKLFAHSTTTYPISDATIADTHAFFLDRLRGYLRDIGFMADEIESVVSQNPSRMDLVVPRLKAVQAFKKLPEAVALATANKRAGNILRKEQFAEVRLAKSDLLSDVAEKALATAIVDIRAKVDAHYDRNEFVDCLKTLASLRAKVDTFFDKVMVNVEDAEVRHNRLSLLSELTYLMNRVADISKLAA